MAWFAVPYCRQSMEVIVIKVRVDEKAGKLFIEADLETPHASSTGKTMIVVTTRGNLKTDQTVQGKPLTIGLNAYISK